MNKEVLRLAGLLACIALATSRIGLIGHELVGHGGVALLAGAEVTEVVLFWFAGGWIRYSVPEPTTASILAIAMAGIALELVVGGALWGFVRGDSLGRRIVRGVGTGLVVHATWYLATGAFHGFGDGLALYRWLGDARVPVAIVAGLATCLATYLGARAITGPLVRTLPGPATAAGSAVPDRVGRRRAIGFAVAVLLAGGLHAGLTIGELRLRRDDTYAKVMQTERDRRVAREMAAWERERAARGDLPTPESRRVERVRLERKHRSFPFVFVLGGATLVSLIAGIARTRPGADERISRGLLARSLLVAVVSICAVIVLGAVLPG
jgi:hypothetical protein